MAAKISVSMAAIATHLLLGGGWGTVAGATEPQSLFLERVDVNIVNVEVFVSGEQEQDLTVEDFELLEDGQPVEISNFYASERLDRVTADLEADRRMVEQGQQGSPPGLPAPRVVPEDQRLSLVVYIDNTNLLPENRRQVLKELGLFLEDRIFQGDRVMVVASGRRLEVVQGFTQDMVQVMRAIEGIAEQAAYRTQDEAERRRLERMIFDNGDRATSESARISALDAIRLYVQQRRLESERSLRSLQSVVRQMGGLLGRKALLVVSDGMEKRPGQGLYQLYEDSFGADVANRYSAGLEPFRTDLKDALAEVTREANAHQVTLYTLHARGPAGAARSNAGVNGAAATLTVGGSLNADMLEHSSSQETLIDLADATGGKAILNTRNFGGELASLSQDFDRLYSLGYRSRHGGDGKFHRIEVRVKKPGLKVRHRSGYVDKDLETRISDRTLSAILFGQETNPGGISVELYSPEPGKKDTFKVSLLVRIPFDQITVLPEGSHLKGRLKIFVAVQDDVGVSDIQQMAFPVDIASKDLPKVKGKELGHAAHLQMRAGKSRLAIGVWDEISGTESYLQREVLLEDPKAKPKKSRG